MVDSFKKNNPFLSLRLQPQVWQALVAFPASPGHDKQTVLLSDGHEITVIGCGLIVLVLNKTFEPLEKVGCKCK